MDELERIMKENSEQFLDLEPSDGHLERFEQRLIQQKKRGRIIQLSKRISRIAAIGLLALMSSLWAYNEFLQPDNKTLRLGDVSQEYREVEFYFTSQINDRYEDLANSPILEDDVYKSELLDELNQMDSVYSRLQVELGANPNDERIIQAMIQHYQRKLKIMSEILERLKAFEQINNPLNKNQNQYESVEL